jgi:hypothetical protein
MMTEREVGLSNALNDRAVAHPSTECGSNNNGEEQKTACKKVTGGSPCRQTALLRVLSAPGFKGLSTGPGYGGTDLADPQNIDPIPHPVLASNHGVYPASLLSLRPTFLRVSRDILRYS